MASASLLTRQEASRYLFERWGVRRAAATLAKRAVIGGGPVFEKEGRRAVYRTENLDKWAQGRLSGPYASTSQYPR